MRRIMISVSFLVVLFSQGLFASAKTDSIVAFLDGAHAKFVWRQWAWCNDDYTPKDQAAAVADGISLILIDTREGKERKLLGGQDLEINFPRISRSAKWVTFIDENARKTYIIDLTTDSPARQTLLDNSAGCAYWMAAAWWINPDNGDEYVFSLDVANYGLYKVKVNNDGTADLPGTKIEIDGADQMDWTYSVSADGNKLGGAFPWPDTKILDIATGNLLGRHAGGFGCQSNLAPDNSYRFFHCEGDHLGIMMFGSDLQDPTNWFVNLSANLAGVPNPGGGTAMDFNSTRWTNHVQYYTASCPMGDNYEAYCSNPGDQQDGCYMSEGYSSLWTQTAEWVQTQINMLKVPKFYIGKFSADFKTQEKSFMIGADPRYMQYGGDAWICTGTTYGSQCDGVGMSPALRGERMPKPSVVRSGAFVTIHTGSVASSAIRLIDSRGKVIRNWNGSGTCEFNVQDLAAGTYMVSVISGGRSEIMPLLVVKNSR